MTLGFREAARPVTAQGHWRAISSSVRRGRKGGRTTFFHHLANDAVGENHGRCAVFESEVETESYEIGHFLNGGGSEDDEVVVAVTASASGLPVVGL